MDTIDTYSYQARLIIRHLNGDLTEKERTELEAWMASDDRHRRVFEELTRGEWLKEGLQFLESIPVEDAWQKVAARTVQRVPELPERKRRIGWWAVAAAIAASLFFSIQYFREDPVPVVKTAERISPGADKATLTLADGSVMELEAMSADDIIIQGGVRVINLSGKLMYTGVAKNGEIAYNTIRTPPGGQYQLQLSDGTIVWLNASSSLRFPTTFNGDARTVELTGEGYFEVRHDPSKTFTVNLAFGPQLTVQGTSFNINAYPDEPFVRATLLDGKISVGQNGVVKVLVPGQQARWSDREGLKVADDADTDQAIAWKNGQFVFKSMDIRSIMRQISRWYDVEVAYSGAIGSDLFSGIVSRQSSLEQVLKILEEGGVRFRIEGRRITVFEK